MKKILIFTLATLMLLGATTACSEKGNVSTNKDGMITEASEMVEDLTDMLTEATTEPTTAKSSVQATEHSSPNTDLGESESTDDASAETGDQARYRRGLR